MTITARELARRLREARRAAGISQEGAALALGLTRSVISQMERGARTVSSLELDRLAGLYGRDAAGLLADEFQPEEIVLTRLRAEARADEMASVQRVGSWCRQVISELRNLEVLLEIEGNDISAPFYQLGPPHSVWQAIQQGERVAGEERRRLALEDRPLSDASWLLEQQGIRTFLQDLPTHLSGLSMMDARWGLVAVVNRSHHSVRRRFSWIHEYGHIIFDRDQKATLSRTSDRKALGEVRANAFAAAFLMPSEGMRRAADQLGKGRPGREKAVIFAAGSEPIVAERRRSAAHQALGLEDVIVIAGRFGVSRIAALYRLVNLGLITQTEFDRLAAQDQEEGQMLARALGIESNGETTETAHTPRDFRAHFMDLALRAFERELISQSKLYEHADLMGISRQHIDRVTASRSLAQEPQIILPGDLG